MIEFEPARTSPITWNQLGVEVTTHARGGLTAAENDFILAAKIDGILFRSPFQFFVPAAT
jgi:Pterin 4 alpha carbinolamine dehydratase